MSKKIILSRLLFLAFFAVIFFAVRLPYFNTGWDGTDGNGHDSIIFLNRIHGPNYLLFARLQGQEIYGPAAGHPAPMYEMLAYLGAFVQKFVDFSALDGQGIIFRLKAIAATVQVLFFLALLSLVLGLGGAMSARKRMTLLALLFCSAFVPIAVNSSNEFQLDSLFGLAMVGSYSLALAAFALKAVSDRVSLVLATLSAAFLGLGKNEWSLALAAALAVSAGWLLASRLRRLEPDAYRRFARLLAASFIGLVLGNAVSYAVNPWQYVTGLKLVFGMLRVASVLRGVGFLAVGAKVVKHFTYLLPLLVLAGYATVLVIKERRRLDPAALLGYLLAGALFIGFLLETWGGFPRYYVPAFVSLLTACAVLFIRYQGNPRGAAKFGSWAVVALLSLQALAYLVDGEVMVRHFFGTRDLSARTADRSCVHMLNVEDAYRGDYDFIHVYMDVEDSQKEMAKRGLKLCRYYRQPAFNVMDQVLKLD